MTRKGYDFYLENPLQIRYQICGIYILTDNKQKMFASFD